MDIFDQIPNSLQEAIDLLLTLKDAEEVANSYAAPIDFMSMCHQGTGRTIRNEWNLWKGCNACPVAEAPLYYWFYNRGLSHPDDISGCILKAVWCEVKGVEFDLAAKIKQYQTYWEVCWDTEWRSVNKVVENVIAKYEAPKLEHSYNVKWPNSK